MSQMDPLTSFFGSVALIRAGRVHLPRQRVGQTLELEGETWVIFREIIVDPAGSQPEKPGALFRPRFHVAGMSPKMNMWFSWLPILFFIGLPGFRSKLWLFHPQTGDMSGYYEWDTVEDAVSYGDSFAAKFMTRRSVPGSVSFQVIPLEAFAQK